MSAPSSNGMSPRDCALAYARAGLSVVPIRADGSKSPTRPWKELERRILSEDEIRRCFHARTGIAIVGGKISGGVECIDLDRSDLFEPFAALLEAVAPGLLARLTHNRTPRPGDHLPYRCAVVEGNQDLAQELETDPATGAPVIDPNTGRQKIKTLIETRGEGGYFLAPGSPPESHETGRIYEHVGGPALTAIATITPEERELLLSLARTFHRLVETDGEAEQGAKPRDTHSGLLPGDDFASRVTWSEILGPHGWINTWQSQHVTFWRRPGKDVGISATTGLQSRSGNELLCVFSTNASPFTVPTGKKCGAYSKFAAYALLNHGGEFRAAAAALYERGYGSRDGEVQPQRANRQTRASQSTAPKAAALPRQPKVAPYKSYPVDALPEPVRGFVRAGAMAINVDPALLAMPMLSMVGAAIGTTRCVRLSSTWAEFPIVWSMIVAPSGAKKSPALRAVLRYAWARQTRAHTAYLRAQAEYDRQVQEYERDLARWRSPKGGGEQPVRPTEPIQRRYVADDTTIEMLAVMLMEERRGLLVARDELSGWFGSFDQYRGGKQSSDAARWLTLWNGDVLRVERKTGQPRIIHVPRAAVSICGTIQPEVLTRCLGREHVEDGLAARFLLVAPKIRPAFYRDAGIDRGTLTAFEDVLDALYGLEHEYDDDDQPEPLVVPIAPDAKGRWVECHDRLAREAARADGALASAAIKLQAYSARLALIVHMVRRAADHTIDEAIDKVSIESAISLIIWHWHETQRVYAMLGETEAERELRQLADWLRDRGGATAAELRRSGPRRYRDQEVADEAALSLVRLGLAAWQTVDHAGGPGQPTRRLIATQPTFDEPVGDDAGLTDLGYGYTNSANSEENRISVSISTLRIGDGDPADEANRRLAEAADEDNEFLERGDAA